jgi:uncharacterized protein YbcI
MSSDPGAHAQRSAIPDRIVALLKEGIGRGPESARAFIHDNLVLAVFTNTLTRGEQVLAEDERIGLVREMRRAFLSTLRDEIVAVVEDETGRKVVGVLNDHAVDPDYAICAFVLAREDQSDAGPDPSTETNDKRRAISRGMTSVYKDFIGRGPTNVRTYIDDKGESVRQMRREFQNSIKEQAVALIEETTDHEIIAFLSDHSIEPDAAIEVFILDGPLEENGESLEERADAARAPALDGETD